jgi:RNA polymerase sigma factor (sigma-70 family)
MTTTPASALGDVDLVVRCRDRDGAAWHELVERFSRYVYAIARVYGLYGPDAEDVFQDTFRRVYERLGELRREEAVRAWIGQVAHRVSLDTVRRRRRELPSDELVETAQPDEALARIELAMDVHAALARLPEPCREVLDRFFTRDESYHTISDELGLPPGTIASRISRCLDRLRVTWEDPGTPPRP